jgi:hypothetical protein
MMTRVELHVKGGYDEWIQTRMKLAPQLLMRNPDTKFNTYPLSVLGDETCYSA